MDDSKRTASSANVPKVYSAINMEEESLQRLRERCDLKVCKNFVATREELLEGVPGVIVIGCIGLNNIDVAVLDAAGPSLKAVCTHSAGYNHIDLAACKERNIRVGYMGDVVSGCMAEFTIALMIATGRRFKEAILDLPRGGWKNWSPSFMLGFQLLNSTVGLVGLGNIGKELVKRLHAFNVKKIYYSGPRRKPEGDALGVHYTTFEDLLQKSDYVVATCAMNEETRLMFNRKAFSLMKATAIFVNVTRGEVVDQEALYEALTTKKIFAAGLDVTTPEPIPADHPLVALENCVILPHIGTAVKAMRKQMADIAVNNILAAVNGEPLPSELTL